MDEKQLQLLWESHAKNGGFRDYNEFRSLMMNPNSRKVYFDDANAQLGFRDYNEFETILQVKKKESAPLSVAQLPSGYSSGKLPSSYALSGNQNDVAATPSRFRERARKEERENYIAQQPSATTTKLTSTDARVGGDQQFKNEDIGKASKKLGKAAVLGLSSVPSGILKTVGIAAKRLDFFNEYKDKTAEELATYKAGQWIEDTVKDLVGDLTPEEQDEFAVKLASGVGQMAGFMVGGAGSRLLKMSSGLTTAGLGAAVNASAEYDNAIRSGATPDVAAKAFWINAAIGTTEALPIMGAFRKLDKYSGGIATGALARKLASSATGRITNEVAQGFINEAAQEATQQILTNITAKNTYDATREIFDGVAESSAIGGLIGSTMTGVIASIREKRASGNLTEEENAELSKAEKFAEDKIREEQVAIANGNYVTKVKENISHLPEKQQDEFLKQSLREKISNDNAEKLTDPTLVKQEKERAKEAHEIKTQILAGKDPDEILTEAQQKAIEEKEKADKDIISLEENKKLDNKEIDIKINELDKESALYRVRKDKLEQQRKEQNDYYDSRIKKIKNDSKDIGRLPSEIREGQEPLKTESDKGASPQEISDSRMVQGSSEEEIASHEEHQKLENEIIGKDKTITEDEAGDIAAIYTHSQETDRPLSIDEAIDFYKKEKHTFSEEINQGEKPERSVATKETPEIPQPETTETEVGEPPTTPPPTETEGAEKGSGRDKGILNRLYEAEKVPDESKKAFLEKGLKYEPQGKEESLTMAKEIIDELGIDQAVVLSEANRFKGGVRSAIFAESLTRLAEAEQNAKTPQEKIDAATKFAEIGIRYDEFSREQGRDISQIDYFYKKSPLGVQIRENIKRAEDFEQWSKPKDKSWKEFFEELKKEPEFEKLFKEEVKEELKKERAESRKARKEKVDKFFDDAKKSFEEGGAMYATIIPPKVITAAIEGMRKAYHAGEKVAELIQKAIDEISEALGSAPWDKEKFRKEWEEKLKEKAPKEKLTDEELKAKVLDRFRKKLKGLTEKQKDDVIRQAHKELIENGALEYEDFKKIIARVTGRGELTEAEAARLKELVKQTNELEAVARTTREKRTPESLDEYKKAQAITARATRELNDIFYNKPDIVKRLTGIMQLNTLGIVSLINNPVYNIINQLGVRFPIGALNDIADRIISGVSKNYEKEFNVFETQKDFWNMVGIGAKEAGEQLLTGLNRSDYTQKELYSEQIRPFKAIRDLNAYRKGEIQLSKRQVIDKMLQGTVGIPAEAVARMLNIGDKPQRFAAGGAQGAAFAKSLGLKGIDKKLFMEFPREEAYRAYKGQGLSDAVASQKADYIKAAIEKEAQRSTFQQDNILNDLIVSAAGKVFGGKDTGLAALAKTLVISPYIKIPTNAFWSMYNLLNPEVALLQATVHGVRSAAAKGKDVNKSKLQLREARYWLAHAIVGMATRAVIMALVQRGAFTPSMDEDDPKKEREATNWFDRAGTVQIGNMKISNRWFGQWGMLGNQIAKKYQDMTPEQKENSDEFFNIIYGGMEKEGLRELENGVFSNSASLIEMVYGRGGGVGDRYLSNTLNLFTNIIQPATLAQTNRALLDEVPSSKGDSFLEKVDQNFAQRSLLYRTLFDKNIKYKRNMWGETIPKGGNVLSRMFGISKANPQLFARKLYDDYLRTNDTGFLVPAVSETLNGQKLNSKQYEKLMEYVGQERKRLVEPYINDMALIGDFSKTYSQLDDAKKKRTLDYLYDYGRLLGLQRFYADFSEFRPKDKPETKEEEDAIFEAWRSEIKDQNPIENDR